jgi:hypothetical protein
MPASPGSIGRYETLHGLAGRAPSSIAAPLLGELVVDTTGQRGPEVRASISSLRSQS